MLAEQVFGAFDQVRLYDTAFVHNDNKIYFFKRLFIEQVVGQEDRQRSFVPNKQDKYKNLNDFYDFDENPIGPNPFAQQKPKAYIRTFLQLYRYDLEAKEESPIESVCFEESAQGRANAASDFES